MPVVFNVVLELEPEVVHVLLHVVLEGGELLQVPVPHLVLPALELRPDTRDILQLSRPWSSLIMTIVIIIRVIIIIVTVS